MKPRRVRSSYARTKARICLRENGLTSPPINIIELIEKYGTVLFTDEISQGFTAYLVKQNVYRVFINPFSVNAGRMNWTLCHELAHIVLGHFIEFGMDNLNVSQEKILDRECDIFVREFLMPEEWVLKYLELPLTVPQLGKLKDKFDVSWEALQYRFKELGICEKKEVDKLFVEWRNGNKHGIIYVERSFIEYRTLNRYNVNFCTMLKGINKLTKPFKITRMDEKNRFLECPICGNTHFSYDASFCKLCGLYLHNDCLNSPYDPRTAYEECGRANVANALFCEHCGSKTMLYDYLQKDGYNSEEEMREVGFAAETEDTIRKVPRDEQEKDFPF